MLAERCEEVSSRAELDGLLIGLLAFPRVSGTGASWAAAALAGYLTVRPGELLCAQADLDSGQIARLKVILVRACRSAEDEHLRKLAEVWAVVAGCPVG